MNSERKGNRSRAALLVVSALLVTFLRNIPVLSIMPFAIRITECLTVLCILCAATQAEWKASVLIDLLIPVVLWLQRSIDGYMAPVYMLSNLTITVCAFLLAHAEAGRWVRRFVPTLAAFCILLIGSAVAIWTIKRENVVRSLVIAWNTNLLSGVSMLAAALLCCFPIVPKDSSAKS